MVIAVGLLAIALLVGIPLVPSGATGFIGRGEFLTYLMWANGVMLFGFNLLPAFPMDGGRVLRALLSTSLGQATATEIAVKTGAGMSLLFVLAGLLSGSPFLPLVGMFVFFAGQQELAAVRHREARRRAEPLEVIPVEEGVVDGTSLPITPGFSGFIWDRKARLWVEWREGRPVQTISV
jgi:hypothetical protein